MHWPALALAIGGAKLRESEAGCFTLQHGAQNPRPDFGRFYFIPGFAWLCFGVDEHPFATYFDVHQGPSYWSSRNPGVNS